MGAEPRREEIIFRDLSLLYGCRRTVSRAVCFMNPSRSSPAQVFLGAELRVVANIPSYGG